MMGFGLREWLFILGPLFIVGILAHGYWRMRSNRQNLKMALDKTFVSKPGEEESKEDAKEDEVVSEETVAVDDIVVEDVEDVEDVDDVDDVGESTEEKKEE